MAKKILLYFFALVGIIALLILVKTALFSTKQTLFGASSAFVAGPMGKTWSGESAAPASAVSRLGRSSFSQQAKLQSANPTTRMIIRNATLNLEVKKVAKAIDDISAMASKSEGFVVSSKYYDSGNDSVQKSATIIIRIPAKGLTDVLKQLRQYAIKVISEQVTGQDITDRFIDLKSKEKNLESALSQLDTIMKRAKKTADVLAVFAEQTKLQQQLDVLKGRINYYQKSVAFSRITLYLTEDKAIIDKIIREKNQWKLTKVIKSAYHSLQSGIKTSINTLVFFSISMLPLLMLWGVIFYIIYLIVMAVYHKMKK
jgi:Domain of unknown function (DUF4349)